MNELKANVQRAYLIIKGLEITFLALVISLCSFLLINSLQFNFPVMAFIADSGISIYLIFISIICIAFLGVAIFWRLYRIPPFIQAFLVPYYKNLGYSVKNALFHTLKVDISPDLYFRVKLNLYKWASKESCLFHLESMRLANILLNSEKFKMVAERYLLKSDVRRIQFSTNCELDELSERSLLFIQALEEFAQ